MGKIIIDQSIITPVIKEIYKSMKAPDGFNY